MKTSMQNKANKTGNGKARQKSLLKTSSRPVTDIKIYVEFDQCELFLQTIQRPNKRKKASKNIEEVVIVTGWITSRRLWRFIG